MTDEDRDADAYQIDAAIDRLMRKEAELNPQRKFRAPKNPFKNGDLRSYLIFGAAACVVIFILGAVFGA